MNFKPLSASRVHLSLCERALPVAPSCIIYISIGRVTSVCFNRFSLLRGTYLRPRSIWSILKPSILHFKCEISPLFQFSDPRHSTKHFCFALFQNSLNSIEITLYIYFYSTTIHITRLNWCANVMCSLFLCVEIIIVPIRLYVWKKMVQISLSLSLSLGPD